MEGQLTGRKHYLARWQGLKNERASWDPHWMELARFLLPRSSRFMVTDRNNGAKKHNHIIDNTGTRALRTLGAGLMSGMTSPARPWFRIATADTALMKSHAVKVWTNDVTQLMRRIFSKSNTYNAFHTMYEELGVFGTGASVIVPHFGNVLHHHTMTAGEYAIFTDEYGMVCGLYRELDMTVEQLVRMFGVNNCSRAVRNLWDRGGAGRNAWVTVIHAIEPRYERDMRMLDNRNMKWASCYFEIGANENQMLRESGLPFFDALCPRWITTSSDVYGTSCAMDALGDVKQLQQQNLRKSEGIDYMTKPPLQAPVAFKDTAHNLFPGGMSYVDSANPQGGIRTAFEVNLDLSHLTEDIRDVRGRVREAFYYDLFLMLANDTEGRKTATEIAERHEEKMLMIGPILERLHNEQLTPKIEITFRRCLEAGILPPPPREMQGQDLNIEFVSVLAQAQRAIGANSLDRLLGTVGAIGQARPEVWDKINIDEAVDFYADTLGVEPQIIVSSKDVAFIRAKRAEQQQAAAMAEMAPKVAGAAASIAQAGRDNPDLIPSVMDSLQGYR